RIVAEGRAVVVISSSWRILSSKTEIASLLRARGFMGEIVGVTPRLTGERGDEIRAYLNRLPEQPESFVVLDDSSDMTAVEDAFVQTDADEGLADRHVDRALAVLARSSRTTK